MSREPTDQELDARLRRVPIPEGLLGRLEAIANGQEQLDQRLNEVDVPHGLLERLKRIPQAEDDRQADRPLADRRLPVARSLADEASRADDPRTDIDPRTGIDPRIDIEPVSAADRLIDALLRDVPLPPAMASRLRRIPPRQRRRAIWLQSWAMAGLLLLALHLLLGGMADAVRGRGDDRVRSQLVVDNLPTFRWQASAQVLQVAVTARMAPEIELSPPRQAEVRVNPRRPTRASSGSDVVDRTRDLIRRFDLDEDVFMSRYSASGARPHFEDDRVPDLRFPSIVPPRGFDLPLVAGYDRAFLLRSGIRPPIAPARNASLQAITVPLSPTTKSYDETRALVEEGEWPRTRNVRVEDFLAALRYRYELPERGRLSLKLTGGPAPFGAGNAQLLQVVAQAGKARRAAGPVHLVVALDVSNSMRWSRKLQSAREALTTLLRNLDDQDQVSLLVFNERLAMVFDRGTNQARQSLADRIAALRPSGGTDVAAALEVAFRHAERFPDDRRRRRVVLLTDDRSRLEPSRIDRMTRLVSDARRRQIGLTLVDVDQGDEPSAALEAWAAAAGGEVQRLRSPDRIRWSLLDAMIGNSVVARRVSVRLRFDPAVDANINPRPLAFPFPEENRGYLEADRIRRAEISRRHRNLALGLLWFVQNDPDISAEHRAIAAEYHLPADEFADNGHFPFQLYVREGRQAEGALYTHRARRRRDRLDRAHPPPRRCRRGRVVPDRQLSRAQAPPRRHGRAGRLPRHAGGDHAALPAPVPAHDPGSARRRRSSRSRCRRPTSPSQRSAWSRHGWRSARPRAPPRTWRWRPAARSAMCRWGTCRRCCDVVDR